MSRRIALCLTFAACLGLQGCMAAAVGGAVVGTAVGVTGAAVKGTAKVAGAGVRAVVPGDSRKDKRERRERDRDER
jgi:hypothetical protein